METAPGDKPGAVHFHTARAYLEKSTVGAAREAASVTSK